MLRVKIFSGDTRFNEINVLEQAIDHWLENEQPAIRQAIQSCSAGQVVLTFLYDDTHHDSGAVTPEVVEQDLSGAEFDSTDDELDMLPEAELPY